MKQAPGSVYQCVLYCYVGAMITYIWFPFPPQKQKTKQCNALFTETHLSQVFHLITYVLSC